MGIDIHVEIETNVGRVDAVIETEANIYIMEFKMANSQEAMDQIKEKKYYERYLAIGKPIKLIGVGFDPKNRNISDYLVETVAG